MRRAFLVLFVIASLAAFAMARAAWVYPSQQSAYLAFILVAVAAGLLGSALLSGAGRLRDVLPIKIVRVWLHRSRRWADSQLDD